MAACPDFKIIQPARFRKPTAKSIASLAAAGGRKRIFLGLLAASCCVVCLLLGLFLVLPWLGVNPVWLQHVSIFLGLGGIGALAWISLTLVFHIYTGRIMPGIGGLRHLCIRLFLPLMEIVGKLSGIDKMAVRRSFIKVNNEFVCANRHLSTPHKLLLLLPHCMQANSCTRRLGLSLANCANCGNCQLGAIRALGRKYGIHIAIATGGTIARKIVAGQRPDGIIAIACERDLTSGIQDSYPIPVFGILNERPQGPCHDTRVPLETLECVLSFFFENGNQA
ncbi:MAG: DUF116 domain-containing protein [Desulfovibrio sp.]|nr:DUF116 domain-containing protein [Desulfovibrio sp.]